MVANRSFLSWREIPGGVWVADTAPAPIRGTAFGVFNLITGLATLVASVVAGALWDWIGPAGTFLAGALFTAVALLTLLPLRTNVASRSA